LAQVAKFLSELIPMACRINIHMQLTHWLILLPGIWKHSKRGEETLSRQQQTHQYVEGGATKSPEMSRKQVLGGEAEIEHELYRMPQKETEGALSPFNLV